MNGGLELRVTNVVVETPDVRSYDLRSVDGGGLPAFTAGAHIDISLPNGMTRSYSLLNDPTETHRYVIGVALDRVSRGGSRYIHERVHAGDVLPVTEPVNRFPLEESAPHHVLFAGGIGVTPMLSMVARLCALERWWRLYYCVRTRTAAAFVDTLSRYGSAVRVHVDDENDGVFLDIPRAIREAPAGAHFYCCGPPPMMKAFAAASPELPLERVHVEYFCPIESASTRGGYVVELARTGRSVEIPPGETILATLQRIGLRVPHSCIQGVCGTCETRVLEGIPDHRDAILSKAERASNRTMMICCSGSLTPRLVLDL